jgi:uncharacterized protein YegP (UPF0339 family)
MIFTRKNESAGDKSFFVLKAKNKQGIGKSQFYATSASMKGIESVKKNGDGATTVIDDLSA